VQRVTVNLSDDLALALAALAGREHRSVSAQAALLLGDAIGPGPMLGLGGLGAGEPSGGLRTGDGSASTGIVADVAVGASSPAPSPAGRSPSASVPGSFRPDPKPGRK